MFRAASGVKLYSNILLVNRCHCHLSIHECCVLLLGYNENFVFPLAGPLEPPARTVGNPYTTLRRNAVVQNHDGLFRKVKGM